MVGLVRTGGGVSRGLTEQIGRCVALSAALMVTINSLSAQEPEPTQSEKMRRIPERAEIVKASLQGSVQDENYRAVPAVLLTIRSLSDGTKYEASTDVEGTFRMREIPLGAYELRAAREGYEPLVMDRIQVSSSGLVVLRIQVKRLNSTAPPT